jgi:hypothetical protein
MLMNASRGYLTFSRETGKPKMKDGKMIIYSEIQFPVRKK